MDKQKKRRKGSPFASSEKDKPTLSWVSPDFLPADRGGAWYLIVITLSLLISLALYWQKVYSGSVLVIISAASLIFLARQKHKEIKTSIYEKGIVVDDNVYNFAQLKSFGIINAEIPRIKLRQNGKFSREINIPVNSDILEEARQLLLLQLPEEEATEDIIDKINRIIRL